MRILFAISIVALIALLWASFSIAQHVRRARRGRMEQIDPSSPVQNFDIDSPGFDLAADSVEAETDTSQAPPPIPSADCVDASAGPVVSANIADAVAEGTHSGHGSGPASRGIPTNSSSFVDHARL